MKTHFASLRPISLLDCMCMCAGTCVYQSWLIQLFLWYQYYLHISQGYQINTMCATHILKIKLMSVSHNPSRCSSDAYSISQNHDHTSNNISSVLLHTHTDITSYLPKAHRKNNCIQLRHKLPNSLLISVVITLSFYVRGLVSFLRYWINVK